MTRIGSEPRIIVLARASLAMARALARIARRRRSTSDEIVQRLGQVAAGLALHAERDDEKAELRRVDALGDVPQQAVEVAAEPHAGLDAAEFGADRVADLLAGVDDRLGDRQAGAQAPAPSGRSPRGTGR